MNTQYDERVARLRSLYFEVHELELELNAEMVDRLGEESYHFTREVDGTLLITDSMNECQTEWEHDRLPSSKEEVKQVFRAEFTIQVQQKKKYSSTRI